MGLDSAYNTLDVYMEAHPTSIPICCRRVIPSDIMLFKAKVSPETNLCDSIESMCYYSSFVHNRHGYGDWQLTIDDGSGLVGGALCRNASNQLGRDNKLSRKLGSEGTKLSTLC